MYGRVSATVDWSGLGWAGDSPKQTANVVIARTGCLLLGLKLLKKAVIASMLPFLHDDGNKTEAHIAWLLTHFAASVGGTSTLHARAANISWNRLWSIVKGPALTEIRNCLCLLQWYIVTVYMFILPAEGYIICGSLDLLKAVSLAATVKKVSGKYCSK